MSIIPNYMIDFFSNQEDFVVIDRLNTVLIDYEKDQQKSEAYINGHIATQGREIGADYIGMSTFDAKSKELTIRFYDVATSTTICSKVLTFSKSLLGIVLPTESELSLICNEVMSECFQKEIEVIRAIEEKNGKATKLLVFAGHAQRIDLKYKLELYQKIDEQVNERLVKREILIGKGKIVKIEGDQFSHLKVTEGQKTVFQSLSKGEELICKIISW